MELDLNDQVRQTGRCIQELTEKRDSFEVQMAGTAAVNKQLLSRVLFLEEKVSALMHQTGAQTGTQHAPASPCTVRVRGLARTSTAHRAGDGLLKPLGSPGTLPFSSTATSTTPLPGRGYLRQMEERQRGQAAACLRCQVGPKHHGGHNRQDPHCVSSPPTTRSTRTTSREPD